MVGVLSRGYDGAVGGRQVCQLTSLLSAAHALPLTHTASGLCRSVSLIDYYKVVHANTLMSVFHYE